jgi:hypothetical protein
VEGHGEADVVVEEKEEEGLGGVETEEDGCWKVQVENLMRETQKSRKKLGGGTSCRAILGQQKKRMMR